MSNPDPRPPCASFVDCGFDGRCATCGWTQECHSGEGARIIHDVARRPIVIHDVDQRTDEWHYLRLGRLTGSVASEAVAAKTSKGESAGRRNLRVRLMLERITGRSHERSGYQSQAMRDGVEREPLAIAHYEAITGSTVWPVGFVSHETLMIGVSPDGWIGDDGVISVKCPIPATHLETLYTAAIPKNYLDQILHEFWITGRTWCDYCSYNPDFPAGTEAKIIRVERDEKLLARYIEDATWFLREVDLAVQEFRTKYHLEELLRQAVEA